jgi:hypothetical protein
MKRSAFFFSFLFITSLVLTGVGCNPANPEDETATPSSSTPEASLSTPFTLALSETVQVNTNDASGLNVSLVAIENDSRCPIGAQCVWAGEATVQLNISSATMPEQKISLKTNNQPVEFDGYLVTLIDLSPVPTMDVETDPNDYRATLSVSNK